MGKLSVVSGLSTVSVVERFFGLTLDELIKDIDVQEVREKNINEERLNSIYTDKENAKKIIKWGAIIGGGIAAILLFSVIALIIAFV